MHIKPHASERISPRRDCNPTTACSSSSKSPSGRHQTNRRCGCVERQGASQSIWANMREEMVNNYRSLKEYHIYYCWAQWVLLTVTPCLSRNGPRNPDTPFSYASFSVSPMDQHYQYILIKSITDRGRRTHSSSRLGSSLGGASNRTHTRPPIFLQLPGDTCSDPNHPTQTHASK